MFPENHTTSSMQFARETASAFNIIVIKQMCTDDECDLVRSSLITGLILTGKESVIKNHIASLTGVRDFNSASSEKLPMAPYELANTRPEDTMLLGEELATVLKLAANRRVTDLIVPNECKDTHLSQVLEKMQAPTLAQFFKPVFS